MESRNKDIKFTKSKSNYRPYIIADEREPKEIISILSEMDAM